MGKHYLELLFFKVQDEFCIDHARKVSSPQKTSKLKSLQVGMSRKGKERVILVLALWHPQLTSSG